MAIISKRSSLQATFPLLYGIFIRGRLSYEWFIREPILHGLMVFLLLPLLLPFTFILKIYNTPPPFVAMLLFNGIVEVGAVYYILFVFFRKRNSPFVTGFHILLLALFIVSALATLFGFDFSYSFWGSINQSDGLWFLIHLYVYTFLLTWVFPLKKQWESILSLLGAAGFLWGALALIEIKAPFFFYPSVVTPQPLYLGLGNPDYLAHLLLLLLFPSFYGFMETKGGRRLFFLLTIVVLYSVLLLTISAAAVGLSAVALLIFALHRYKKRALVPVIIGVGIITILIAVKSLGPSSLMIGLRDSFLIRVLMWKTLLAGLSERFFFGTGWQGALIAFYRFYDPVLNFFGQTGIDKAHNIIVEYLVTTGILGTLAFVSFWGYMFTRLYRAYSLSKQSLYFALFLLGIINMVFLFFNFNTIIPYVYTYVFVAGIIVVLADGYRFYPRARVPSFLQTVAIGVFIVGMAYMFSMYAVIPLYQNFRITSVKNRLNKASDTYTGDYAKLRPHLEKIAHYRSPYGGVEEMVARIHVDIATQLPVDEQTRDELFRVARRIYEEVSVEHPWSPLHFLSLASLEQNPLESKYIAEAESVSPRYGYTDYYVGLIALDAKNYEEAYRRFYRLSKTNYPLVSLFYLGVTHVARGEVEEGESMIVSSLVPRAAGLAWDYPAIPGTDEMSRLLFVYREKGLKERFTPLLEQMVVKQSNSLLYKYLLLAYKESGKQEKVKELVEFAGERFPQEKYLFNLLAQP